MNNSTYALDYDLTASTGTRFMNYVLDFIFIVILFLMIGLFLGTLIGLFGLTGLAIWMDGLGDVGWNIIALIAMTAYYLVTEGLFGRTIGKFITGTVVVDENGEKPDFGTIVKRNICRFIPFEPLSCFSGRGWHDSMSDTYVVNKKGLDESIKSFHELKLIGIQEID